MSASVPLASVQKMLKACAPGYSMVLKNHHLWVTVNGIHYPSLPKYNDIEVGHIKKMARFFGILECAKKHLGI